MHWTSGKEKYLFAQSCEVLCRRPWSLFLQSTFNLSSWKQSFPKDPFSVPGRSPSLFSFESLDEFLPEPPQDEVNVQYNQWKTVVSGAASRLSAHYTQSVIRNSLIGVYSSETRHVYVSSEGSGLTVRSSELAVSCYVSSILIRAAQLPPLFRNGTWRDVRVMDKFNLWKRFDLWWATWLI